MKIDNEVMWNTAENFAKILNDAFQKQFEQKTKSTNAESFIKVVGWIVESETKKDFVACCSSLIKFEPGMADKLNNIVEMVTKLPMESEIGAQDISFDMFIALAKFHVECVKPNWK